MTSDANVKNRNLKFGVSGLLYHSDMLLYTITKQKFLVANKVGGGNRADDRNPIEIACIDSYKLENLEEKIPSHQASI